MPIVRGQSRVILAMSAILWGLGWVKGNQDLDVNSLHGSCQGSACSQKTNKERYADLKTNIGRIRDVCGEVCDTTKVGIPGKYYNQIEKTVDCDALFRSYDVDRPSDFIEPPMKIPKFLLDAFSYEGRVPIKADYRDESVGSAHWLIWSEEMFDSHIKSHKLGKLGGSYGFESVRDIERHLQELMDVQDKHVLIIGSQRPWLETLVLAAGAKHITTMDYVQITSEHPQVTTVMPKTWAEMYFNGTRFDIMVSFSSVEHSGLGRYGDNLNPWGDLIVMAKAWCAMKPGGQALVGVPSGPDQIRFNSAKVYGDLLYSHLFANWKQIYTESDAAKYSEHCYYCYQPLHIIER